uniref:Small ribosomal subunit protein uS5m n=1 Tax=Erpetoichthys calabaricus TaxID=27687 RepID=A0A8C4TG89_ERPCA
MAASRWLSAALCTAFRGVPAPLAGCQPSLLPRIWQVNVCLPLASASVTLQQYRQSSFFNKLTADELWRGVLAESGAGARKGRGKRTKRKMKKDLNRGQSIGEGRGGFLWPGLNTPLVKSGKVQIMSKRDEVEQEELQAKILQQRDDWDRRKKMKVKRERGWTGSSWGGISLGPPDPGPNGETYEDFESRVIEVKSVFNMTAKEGRKRSISVLVAVGNGNGSAVYHDVTSTFKKTTIRMKKQNPGYGLRCHRAIITMCKLIGVQDMYAKVSGSTNLLNITRALFQGLGKQETHQQLADRKKLHVVEFQDAYGSLPIVVASPKGAVRSDPEPEDEIPDTKLDWNEVKAAQGMTRSSWANLKRTIW